MLFLKFKYVIALLLKKSFSDSHFPCNALKGIQSPWDSVLSQNTACTSASRLLASPSRNVHACLPPFLTFPGPSMLLEHRFLTSRLNSGSSRVLPSKSGMTLPPLKVSPLFLYSALSFRDLSMSLITLWVPRGQGFGTWFYIITILSKRLKFNKCPPPWRIPRSLQSNTIPLTFWTSTIKPGLLLQAARGPFLKLQIPSICL